MTPEIKDRRQKLLLSNALNGIDFVEIVSKQHQEQLGVHFLNHVDVSGHIEQATITGGETIRTIAVNPIQNSDWIKDDEGRPLLRLTARAPGDFSIYTLRLYGDLLDPQFDRAGFSFKALCESDLDCVQPDTQCPPPSGDTPPIDYLAKDFLSFRKALLDFSSLRYPDWRERSEADFGMMFLEALASLGDDLSYFQDRVAAEASLDTASERRSIVRLARLVDYEPRPATCARVLLQFDVLSGPIPAGLLVSAQGPGGEPIDFETGTGLADRSSYTVSPLWNRGHILPYYWDDGQRCLPAGATEMWVAGQGFGFTPGQQLMIETAAATPGDEAIREIFQLTAVAEESDPLFPGTPNPPTPVTHLFWREEDALQSNHDLSWDSQSSEPRTVLAGNLVPATQGRRFTESFAIAPAPASARQAPLAIERAAANSTSDAFVPQYLYTLRNKPLAWFAPDSDPDASPLPEVALSEQPEAGSPRIWTWQPKLLDANADDSAFTIDPYRLTAIARNSDRTVLHEYDGAGGDTLRFGDGTFGLIPQAGSVFQITYRIGAGALGNVASDSITKVDPGAASLIQAARNPKPAAGGADAESDEHVRRIAPQAFRSRKFVVRPEDYEAAAETLPWVQKAGSVFRWTGSWLTVFTTVDQKNSEEIPVGRHTALIDLLNRYRIAGYESYAPAPRYASLDLIVTVCARSDAFRGDVEAGILSALSAAQTPSGAPGFFQADGFTFGMPLERSALEAAIQNVVGVGGILSVRYRRRGAMPDFAEMPDTVTVGKDQIIRMDNDPSRPERGSLRIYVEGGK